MIKNLNQIDFDKLFIFYSICKKGSLQKAIHGTSYSARTVYYYLKALENAFDTKLYVRGKKNFVLTTEGENLFQLSINIFDTLPTITKNNKDDFIGLIKIHSTVGVACYYIPAIITKFSKLYPYVKIEIFSGPEYLDTKFLDFDILIGPEPLSHPELTKSILKTYNYGFYAHQSYIERNGALNTIKDLENHSMLGFTGNHLIEEGILKKSKLIFDSNLYPAIIEACLEGAGIASLPHDIINIIAKRYEQKTSSGLIKVLPDYISETEKIYFYYKRHSVKEKIIRDFYGLLKDRIVAMHLLQ